MANSKVAPKGYRRVIGVSVGMFVCLLWTQKHAKMSTLSEVGQHMSSTCYVGVRNEKILASTYLTNESVHQGAKKSRLFKLFCSLKISF